MPILTCSCRISVRSVLRPVSGRCFYCLPDNLGVTLRDEFLPLFVVVHRENINIQNGKTATTYWDHRLTLTVLLHIVPKKLQLVCCSSVLPSYIAAHNILSLRVLYVSLRIWSLCPSTSPIVRTQTWIKSPRIRQICACNTCSDTQRSRSTWRAWMTRTTVCSSYLACHVIPCFAEESAGADVARHVLL